MERLSWRLHLQVGADRPFSTSTRMRRDGRRRQAAGGGRPRLPDPAPGSQFDQVKAFTVIALVGVTIVALLLWVAFALIVADGPQVRFYSIPSSSMRPALMPGDYVTVHFFGNREDRSVRRGEIVAY
jgi:hypothetical protein